LKVIPPNEIKERGVFASRSPQRPNKIGFSIVRLLNIKKNIIEIKDIDVFDGTPLLDIKPFLQEMDCFDISTISPAEQQNKFDIEK